MERGIPRAGIGSFPTPVEVKPEFGAALGVPDLYLKRDDKSADSYGGNKVRKLEYLLGEALAQDCAAVFTGGGIGSHHVLATVTHAREVGLEPHAVQFPQPLTAHVRENLRVLAAMNPTLRLTRNRVSLAGHLLWQRLTTRFDDERYYIAPGGSSPVGTLGFVEAGRELGRQITADELPEPDVVVVPTSSGGTLAGLRVGFDVAGIDARLLGVRVTDWPLVNSLTVSRMANRVAHLFDPSFEKRYGPGDVDILSGYVGRGYAEPTPEGKQMTEIAAEFGVTLDPTYTAKTVVAIASEFDDETVLYWHTLSDSRPDALSTEKAIERLPDSYRRFFDGSERSGSESRRYNRATD